MEDLLEITKTMTREQVLEVRAKNVEILTGHGVSHIRALAYALDRERQCRLRLGMSMDDMPGHSEEGESDACSKVAERIAEMVKSIDAVLAAAKGGMADLTLKDAQSMRTAVQAARSKMWEIDAALSGEPAFPK